MAQYEYCVQGLSKVCQGIPCDVKDIPKLPNIAEIFKTCPVPGLQESCLLLILLLLIPISAASMFAMRRYILLLVKGPGECSPISSETAQQLVPLNTKSAGLESQTCPVKETQGGSEPASGKHTSGAMSGATSAGEGTVDLGNESDTGNVSPVVESKTHPV
ncbi:uncharacterized protein LOC119729891 isoform X1 [Patiria miniata]|uniref:Uncharacterized protein n=1 Tax=Patiria miniata TaxID=46514 RepID=A0A914A5D4_PATMI|nr:uncharacterized protein LOC119729891 isoform X1 [Patiria miniata]